MDLKNIDLEIWGRDHDMSTMEHRDMLVEMVLFTKSLEQNCSEKNRCPKNMDASREVVGSLKKKLS